MDSNNDDNGPSPCYTSPIDIHCNSCTSACQSFFAQCAYEYCTAEWSSWGACSATCGSGTASRTWQVSVAGVNCDHDDGDTETQACRADDRDSDGICDTSDACVDDPLNDGDSDGVCDGEDACLDDPLNDGDSDGICDGDDTCLDDPLNDEDADGICDLDDPCPGDALNDGDSDAVCDEVDPCMDDPLNDGDSDGICDGGDTCLGDSLNDEDADGICDLDDPCPGDALNDGDSDAVCDEVDPCMNDPLNDGDSDGICDGRDTCLGDPLNDADADGICDLDDPCPGDALNDGDSDAICDEVDPCTSDSLNDGDSDGICDGRDTCLDDPLNDADADGVCDLDDPCPGDALNDGDSDAICDEVDPCMSDSLNDGDSDGICDGRDTCLDDPLNDADADGVCDLDDPCPGDALNDGDSDVICDEVDPCMSDPLNDGDSDGICDGRDACLDDPLNDADSDGICDREDSCLGDSLNDSDNDGACAAEDSCVNDWLNDIDGDALCSDMDSCPRDFENDVDSDSLCADIDSCANDLQNDVDSDNICAPFDSCPIDALNDEAGDNICDDTASVLAAITEQKATTIDVYAALAAMVEEIDGGDPIAVGLFLDAVDSANVGDGTVASIEGLEGFLDQICAAISGNWSNSSVYARNSFTLTCAQPDVSDGGFVVETDGVAVVGFNGDDGSAASITTWTDVSSLANGTANNETEPTVLMADVQGITVTNSNGSPIGQTDSIDEGFQITINVSTSTTDGVDEGFRKRISCRYFSAKRNNTDSWSRRGVFLRGIDVSSSTGGEGIDAAVICVTAHLTLFTVTDEGAEATVVENKVQVVSGRFAALASVDLGSDNTSFNPLITSLFAAITVIFVVIVVVGKQTGRKGAVEEARLVFAQYGRLSRPTVISADEFEAILRGWLSPGQILALVSLQLLSVNAYLSLFFTWSHEHLVYTAADKAYVLYAALLSTFLVQAFFLDVNAGAQTFSTIMTNVFIGAAVANVVLFPVQYLLPYMTANVNSFSTNTVLPRSLVRQQWKALVARLCGTAAAEAERKRREETAEKQMVTAQKFWKASSSQSSHVNTASKQPVVGVSLNTFSKVSKLTKDIRRRAAKWDADRRIVKMLRFMVWKVPLPSRAQIRGQAAEEAKVNASEVEAAAKAVLANAAATRMISRFQKTVRQSQIARRRVRMIEFESWLRHCKAERRMLTFINSVFLGVLGLFTMMVCVLLSAAFNDEQCLRWVAAVGQSILMQVAVTAPLLGVVVLGVKLLFSMVLLRANASARAAARATELQQRLDALALKRELISKKLANLGSSPEQQVNRTRLRAMLQKTEALGKRVSRAKTKLNAATAVEEKAVEQGLGLRHIPSVQAGDQLHMERDADRVTIQIAPDTQQASVGGEMFVKRVSGNRKVVPDRASATKHRRKNRRRVRVLRADADGDVSAGVDEVCRRLLDGWLLLVSCDFLRSSK